MSWSPLAKPINYVLLGGRKSPGIADVAGADDPRNWDVRGGYGLSGATVVFTGNGLSKPSVKLRLYSQQDWDDWDVWKSNVAKPPNGTRPRALDIWHPFLELFHIRSVVVENVLQPVLTNETGEWTIEIKLIQFRRPKIAYAKPEASKTEPIDPVDQTIHRLTGQLQELSK